jgi:hypothetical protein
MYYQLADDKQAIFIQSKTFSLESAQPERYIKLQFKCVKKKIFLTMHKKSVHDVEL